MVRKIAEELSGGGSGIDSWGVLVLATAGILVASVLTALAAGLLFGKYSRYLIGHAGKGNGLLLRLPRPRTA